MNDESKIISWVRTRPQRRDSDLVVGIGDDAAVWRPKPGHDLLVCCDLSVEGVHFRTAWAEPEMIGHKCLAVTISDIAAMGGAPRYALVSAALPAGKPDGFIEGLFAGIFELATRLDVEIIGGDTSASPGPVFLDTTVIGECATDRAIKRSGARPGDLIFVTGSLGGATLGLHFLQTKHETYAEHPGHDILRRARQQAITRHLMPEPRVLAGKTIGASGLATAMIDISDGLSTDLAHLMSESHTGAIIDAESIPIAESVALATQSGLEISPLDLALHGGEEYELLLTSPPENRRALQEAVGSAALQLSCIGKVVSDPGVRIRAGETLTELAPLGYQHSF